MKLSDLPRPVPETRASTIGTKLEAIAQLTAPNSSADTHADRRLRSCTRGGELVPVLSHAPDCCNLPTILVNAVFPNLGQRVAQRRRSKAGATKSIAKSADGSGIASKTLRS